MRQCPRDLKPSCIAWSHLVICTNQISFCPCCCNKSHGTCCLTEVTKMVYHCQTISPGGVPVADVSLAPSSNCNQGSTCERHFITEAGWSVQALNGMFQSKHLGKCLKKSIGIIFLRENDGTNSLQGGLKSLFPEVSGKSHSYACSSQN